MLVVDYGPVSGRVSGWARTDSVSYFDDYTVSR